MKTITVETTIEASIEKVWECWSKPEHITHWAFASDDWHAPKATNDLRTGGKFKTRMESTDGKEGFDFEGVYTAVKKFELIEYKMSDGRRVKIQFIPEEDGVKVIETFDPENENPEEMQRSGWQAILANFKEYCESEEDEEEEEEEKEEKQKNSENKFKPGSSLKTIATFIVGTAVGAAAGASAALVVCQNTMSSSAHVSTPIVETNTPAKNTGAPVSAPASAAASPRKNPTEVKPAATTPEAAGSAGSVAAESGTAKSPDGTSAADGSVVP